MDTYEKKYKESLALMVDCIPDEDGYVHVRPQDIFPELKGSGDEKIRKTLINFFQDWHKNRSHCWGISVPEILTWLEKQGNPTDDEMKEALRTEYEKGRADAFAQMQKEWSKEDENHVISLLERLEGLCRNEFERTRFAINEDQDWLKSLKERYFWKPKTWEIQILESVIEKGENPKNYSATLHSILEQLKKLKGE